MEFGAASDVGMVREQNEDNLFVDKEIGLFIVADGMGGHKAGEVASEMAVSLVSSAIIDKLRTTKDNGMHSLINESFSTANVRIKTKSTESSSFTGMGTTVVLVLANKKKHYVANIGDSRAYHIRQNKIKQITKDHTFVGELVELGTLSKDNARIHPNRNIITRALGTADTAASDIKTINIKEGDYILLCTDGLTDMLKDEEIRDIITSTTGTVADKCNKLIDCANDKGGNDNITVVLLFENNGKVYHQHPKTI